MTVRDPQADYEAEQAIAMCNLLLADPTLFPPKPVAEEPGNEILDVPTEG